MEKSERKIALASGVLRGNSPEHTVRAAAFGGFDGVGLRVNFPEWDWTDADTRATRIALKETGLFVIDVENLRIEPGPFRSVHLRWLDVALEIGAQHVLTTGWGADHGQVVESLGRFCEHVGPSGPRISLEFGYFSNVQTLDQALAIVQQVNHPAQAILVDALHLFRGGTDPSEVAKLPSQLFPYSQFCDIQKDGPLLTDRDAILEEAKENRVNVGEGDIPLAALLQALPPNIPLSLEILSRKLREDFPDINLRAKNVADATRRYLSSVE